MTNDHLTAGIDAMFNHSDDFKHIQVALDAGLDHLLNYLDDPDNHQADLEAGLIQIRQTPNHDTRVKALLQTLIKSTPDPASVPSLESSGALTLLIEFVADVQQTFQAPLALQVAPVKDGTTQRKTYSLKDEKAVSSVGLQVIEEADRQIPQRRNLIIDFQNLAQGPFAQANNKITLRYEDGDFETRTTDHQGKAIFYDIPAYNHSLVLVEFKAVTKQR